jgi:hypothetical protein
LWWLVWCGWYEYGKSIGVKFQEKEYDLFINFNSEVNFIIPYKGVVFISEKPKKIKWSNGILHSDGSPAIEYPDGYPLWALNGVTVPKYLAETPEGKLDIEFFKKEKNADVRAEFIRKFGIERMAGMGKKIDSYKNHSNEWYRKSEYELIDMSPIFQSVSYAPHLRMKNLTTGIWHLEGVAPECKTIDEAIKFRANGKQITIGGIK